MNLRSNKRKERFIEAIKIEQTRSGSGSGSTARSDPSTASQHRSKQLSQKESDMKTLSKLNMKPSKVVLVDLKELINLDAENFSLTKRITNATLVRLQNLERDFKSTKSGDQKSVDEKSCSLLLSFQNYLKT